MNDDLRPMAFSLKEPKQLTIDWNDGHVSKIPIAFLRDECPCAACKGEQGLFGVYYHPKALPILTPNKYVMMKMAPVGSYAVSVTWGDGHDTGLYSWQYLRDLEEVLRATEEAAASRKTGTTESEE